MAFRVSFVFKMAGDYDGGWSENFWTRADTGGGAMTRALALYPLLMGVHGKQTRLTAIRIGPVDGGRRVASKKFNMDENNNAVVTADSDIPTTRLQLLSYNTATYSTKQWLGGIPDIIVSKGRYVPNGAFTTAMTALTDHLALNANQWGMRVLSAANLFKNIENITNAGVVKVTGHGFANGDRVLVSRVDGIDNANGQWLIDVTGDDNFTLRDWGAVHGGLAAVQNGRVKLQNYVMVATTACEPGLATKHNVGRPSNLFGGRRRPR